VKQAGNGHSERLENLAVAMRWQFPKISTSGEMLPPSPQSCFILYCQEVGGGDGIRTHDTDVNRITV
jgi:hypothetical protein